MLFLCMYRTYIVVAVKLGKAGKSMILRPRDSSNKSSMVQVQEWWHFINYIPEFMNVCTIPLFSRKSKSMLGSVSFNYSRLLTL